MENDNDKVIACNMTMEDIVSLAGVIEKNGLERIKIKNGDSEIVIESEKKVHASVADVPARESAQTSVPTGAGEKTGDFSGSPDIPDGNIVKAPIVGIYYAAPSPDRPPFVKVGDRVKKGDVIMIIEAMKTMNEVQSDYDGIVTDILVDNGQSVEYDQPVMIIG